MMKGRREERGRKREEEGGRWRKREEEGERGRKREGGRERRREGGKEGGEKEGGCRVWEMRIEFCLLELRRRKEKERRVGSEESYCHRW